MGNIRMSEKERRRLGVMARVESGDLKLSDASEMLRVSYRQMKRIRNRYREEGDIGLIHKSRGRESNRGYKEDLKSFVIELYRQRYPDFGPTLFSEKLLEVHGIGIDHETLRQWLIKKGLWVKSRKKSKHRSWRQRRAHFGELVQMDGSHHGWFEERREKCCLMVMVDDATGRTMALMSEEETTASAMKLLWLWIDRYGMPKALYTDKKNVYITEREPTIEEELSGQKPLTIFGKACNKLGIQIIPAHSPQAKGRVERKNGVFQDRLVKELRLRGINDIVATNRLLPEFTEKLNSKFTVEPTSPADYHKAIPEGLSLADIFCREESRVLTNDWTIRFENRLFQIEKQSNLPPVKSMVIVLQHLDNSIHILYRNQPVRFKELAFRLPQEKKSVKRQKTWKPGTDHPWRNNRINVKHGELWELSP